MSTRTIIEINHDYWHDLKNNPEIMREILNHIQDRALRECPQGIRILGSRHHSQTLELKVR